MFRLLKAAHLLEKRLKEDSGINFFTNDHWLENAVKEVVRSHIMDKLHEAFSTEMISHLLEKILHEATEDINTQMKNELFKEKLSKTLSDKYIFELRKMAGMDVNKDGHELSD